MVITALLTIALLTPPQTAPVDHAVRDAYFTRMLTPQEDPVVAPPGPSADRHYKRAYEAAEALWMRYVTLPMPPGELTEARMLLQGARELFVERYEIAENSAGGAPNLATPEQELAWGFQYAQELAASGMTLLDDRATVAYVEELCERLVAKSRRFPTNYQLFVLNTASVNATSAPGYIFVYRGLLEAAPSEAALAGVLAHEIGHSLAHHGAKKVTRSYQDQKHLAKLQASDSKLSKFLAKMMELGNPVGALTFSREAEEQADRLAMHIAFDAGFEPEGLADMFQVFEQMEPSSRSSWDLMARTHPFSIDRINTVREYAALLTERTLVTSSTFKTLKTRLSKLPPPPDATGLMKAPAPFSGQMPQGWNTKKHSVQTTLFEAPKGTPEGEACRSPSGASTTTSRACSS